MVSLLYGRRGSVGRCDEDEGDRRVAKVVRRDGQSRRVRVEMRRVCYDM